MAEELVRSSDLPRAVLFCLRTSLDAVGRITGEPGTPQRLLGRLCAELEFGEVTDTSGPAVTRTLFGLLTGIHGVGEAITKVYFSSRAVPVGVGLQEAQQQQCG